MKILVIGGTRFIGLAAVRRLHELGHQLTVVNRGQSVAELPEGVARLTGERGRLAALREDVERIAPEVVLHCIVATEGDARELVELSSGAASRTVMLSSMDVYRAYGRLTLTEPGPPDPVPIDEDAPLRERWYPYRERFPDPAHHLHHYDKIPAERVTLSATGLPGSVLRLPMVIGPNDYQHRLHAHLKPMLDGRDTIVMQRESARWRSTYGFVDNVADAIALACTDERAVGRTYNVADAALSTLQQARVVAGVLGWTGDFVPIPLADVPDPLVAELGWEEQLGWDQDLVCSTERIRSELGYQPRVPLEEAVRRTVEWERDNPPPEVPPGAFDYDAWDRALEARR